MGELNVAGLATMLVLYVVIFFVGLLGARKKRQQSKEVTDASNSRLLMNGGPQIRARHQHLHNRCHVGRRRLFERYRGGNHITGPGVVPSGVRLLAQFTYGSVLALLFYGP
ncbi:hypothetical protein MRX96_017015 [Rhipicephalus microplus]